MKDSELRERVEARKHELLAKLHDLKADTHHESKDARARTQRKLDELELYLKSGWDKIDASVRSKLDKWLSSDR